MFNRQIEDIRIQKLEHRDPHLFVASIAESSHRAEPVLTLQFLFGNFFDHVEKLLCDEAFEFAEGLLFKNNAYFRSVVGVGFVKNQFSNFPKQGCEWVPQSSLQFLLALKRGQLRELTALELQKGFHLVVNVRPVRCRGRFFARQQL